MNHISKMTYYAVLYAGLREEAFKHGYALALHGSLQKDLDVVAVPWVEVVSDPDTLAKALCNRANGVIVDGSVRNEFGIFIRETNPKKKPHGRLAYTIHLGSDSGYVDLSVIALKVNI